MSGWQTLFYKEWLRFWKVSVQTVLALDVGGTKVAAGRVSADGRLLARASRPTPSGADGDGALRRADRSRRTQATREPRLLRRL